MELAKKFDATQEAVKEVQIDMLTKLRDIRKAMCESSSAVTSNKEMEALQKENEKLKLQNVKQAYRVEHLVRSVKELQSKLKETEQKQ